MAMAWLAWESRVHLQELTREPAGPKEVLRLRSADWLVTVPSAPGHCTCVPDLEGLACSFLVSGLKCLTCPQESLRYHLHNS